MPNINKANRQVCDVDIRDVATMKPVLFFETANTTTQNISSESVFAMAKGTKRVAFANPLEGTMTIEAQVYPFELYSLMTDGIIESEASYPVRETIKCTTAGEITIPAGAVAGTVFVFASGDFAGKEITGTFADGKFTATQASDIAIDTEYEVGYIVSKSEKVKKISFNNTKLPKAYYVTMNTVEKDENEVLTPYKIIAYKAQPQRNFELSQSSEGDPSALSMTFDLLETKDGKFVDMVEIEE
ncbi:hypothetical protein GKG47_08860 [Lactonifactor sp. BIOML-A3]|uniref:hypothetical protein n=1 Tax=unclassified Lactonifactor TaxID=2636670 RepID=UPI0012B01337|nr:MULTISPECIES: hypothetical protein [unclassified Lactonifactor]MSA02150.1 hypothetical protein [Lactonifactor sp. BIOML-A5]MSA07935.1 hypothetical protein [Lactonifactor sp. BIOML-A4]MSA12551.1 hypothetical protein [Lactonifactor sp. BIOML-A3]MSA16748.1 hypothetical protein [Lactonifactor sp. BIOML-A2]MSA37553.1 hypothetical protein [Lactonifactor sp. BIOML-A1]